MNSSQKVLTLSQECFKSLDQFHQELAKIGVKKGLVKITSGKVHIHNAKQENKEESGSVIAK